MVERVTCLHEESCASEIGIALSHGVFAAQKSIQTPHPLYASCSFWIPNRERYQAHALSHDNCWQEMNSSLTLQGMPWFEAVTVSLS